MAASPRSRIVEAIIEAIRASGYSGVLVSALRSHPARFALAASDGREFTLAVYAWTLTPGGRPKLANEYRIQMTSVKSPLEVRQQDITVLLGYEPNLQLFGGFDLGRHRIFTTGSPSIQIDIRTVRGALQDGLSFGRKSNDEIAVGVRPDQFMAYALNASDLHRYGRDARTFSLLTMASTLEIIPAEELEHLTAERQRILQTVSRLSRLANFRRTVLQAYDNRCAVTRVQLRLVDAAHILPVGSAGQRRSRA